MATATTAEPFGDLTAFQRDLLAVIARAESEQVSPYGLGIKQELQPLYDTEINHGQLYPNLDSLVERGLVEKGQIDRRTNSYELTDHGQRMLRSYQSWLGDCMEQSDG